MPTIEEQFEAWYDSRAGIKPLPPAAEESFRAGYAAAIAESITGGDHAA